MDDNLHKLKIENNNIIVTIETVYIYIYLFVYTEFQNPELDKNREKDYLITYKFLLWSDRTHTFIPKQITFEQTAKLLNWNAIDNV